MMKTDEHRRKFNKAVLGLGAASVSITQVGVTMAQKSTEMPLFDAHIHYSHDAWQVVPPKQAAEILRKAGLKRALVSSSNDEGTQMLLKEAPEIILLRPYRRRSDVSTWVRDAEISKYMEDRAAKYKYVGVGEFHLYGDEADLAVPKRMVAMARENSWVLHAHSDTLAIEGLFKQWPQARILWAHSGFDRPDKVREMLKRHPRLWCDLAYRGDHASDGKIDPAWREAFLEFPDRFMTGTDTFTPERWHYIGTQANYSRAWLADLPLAAAEKIAWRNSDTLFNTKSV
jgi:Amidohydrolase